MTFFNSESGVIFKGLRYETETPKNCSQFVILHTWDKNNDKK